MLRPRSSEQQHFFLWNFVDTGRKAETLPVNVCARAVCALQRDRLPNNGSDTSAIGSEPGKADTEPSPNLKEIYLFQLLLNGYSEVFLSESINSLVSQQATVSWHPENGDAMRSVVSIRRALVRNISLLCVCVCVTLSTFVQRNANRTRTSY